MVAYYVNDRPGGKAPQYYASILLKFVAIGGEKFTPEDDGFDGFGSKIWVIKCRTNTNGKTIHMIYEKYRGFDALRTCVAYAKDLGLISGNRNGYYFNNLENGKEHKFTQKDMRKNFREDTELYTMLYDSIIPILDKELVLLNEEDTNVPDAELNY